MSILFINFIVSLTMMQIIKIVQLHYLAFKVLSMHKFYFVLL